MRRPRLGGFRLLGFLLLFVACDDDQSPPVGPPRTAPLEFLSLIHPAEVVQGAPSLLRAGALAGTDLCWTIQEAHVEVRGSELRLSGTGISYTPAAACPQALAYDSVDVMVPPLAAGTYVLVASGLTDTLVVSRFSTALVERFAAEGILSPPSFSGGCPKFAPVVLQRLRGGLIDAPPVNLTSQVTLYGEIAPDFYCEELPRHALRFRRVEAIP